MQEFKKSIIRVLLAILLTLAFGTGGYMLIERWSFLDSLYMTVITLTTVGYREVHDLSKGGMIFTMILLVGGVGVVIFALSKGAQVILDLEYNQIFRRKRVEKAIRELKNHYIICGYGRMGKIISKELREEGVQFLVIEKRTAQPEEEGVLILKGDATRDETLHEAGIDRAAGLISVLPSDAENLFVVLSARGLNPKLLIVARAVEEGAERKLIRAGATKVISPYHIGGLRMAHTVLKPTVVDFIEFATRSGNLELQIEEIQIQEKSELIGLTLEECGIGRDLGVIIVAIKQATGDTRFNPTFRSTVKPGDTLIALGERSKLRRVGEMARGKMTGDGKGTGKS
jgi:voltage-gated potassium channel